MQHHIVERIALADGLVVAAHLGLQQEAVFHQVVAVKHCGDLFFQLVRANIGEEAQVAAVDPQDRDVVPCQSTGGAEQAAVTADDDDQVAYFAQQLARGGLQAVARQHFGNGVLEDHVQVALEEEFFQSANGVEHLRAAKAADDTDIAKLLHGAPARLCGG
ncbi:hypothetical protein D3C78_578960 [compost metagenome]